MSVCQGVVTPIHTILEILTMTFTVWPLDCTAKWLL